MATNRFPSDSMAMSTPVRHRFAGDPTNYFLLGIRSWMWYFSSTGSFLRYVHVDIIDLGRFHRQVVLSTGSFFRHHWFCSSDLPMNSYSIAIFMNRFFERLIMILAGCTNFVIIGVITYTSVSLCSMVPCHQAQPIQ